MIGEGYTIVGGEERVQNMQKRLMEGPITLQLPLVHRYDRKVRLHDPPSPTPFFFKCVSLFQVFSFVVTSVALRG